MNQQEFEAMMFGPGHCTGCGETKKLVMVQAKEEMEDEETGVVVGQLDPATRRGLCYDCAMARFSRKH